MHVSDRLDLFDMSVNEAHLVARVEIELQLHAPNDAG